MFAVKNVSKTLWIKITILSVLFLIAYWVPIKGIADAWFSSEDYS